VDLWNIGIETAWDLIVIGFYGRLEEVAMVSLNVVKIKARVEDFGG